VDESVFYIQQDYAGDPRQFYFGTKRPQIVQTQSTINQKSYARLVEGEKEQLIDDRELERRQSGVRREDAQYKDELDRDGYALGDVLTRRSFGGVSGGAMQAESVVNRLALNGNMPTAAPMLGAAFKSLDKRKVAEEPG